METNRKGETVQSVYSAFGSRLHLILEDSVAEAYNRAIDAFFAGQQNYHEFHETKWNPKKPLAIEIGPEELKAFNGIGRLINLMGEINGGGLDIPEDEMTSDYLVKL